MQSVFQTLFFEHDLRLVALAALVCATASFAAIVLLSHARKSEDGVRKTWVAVAAVVTGFGIWSTHFIAMQAFDPGVDAGYDVPLTLLSLLIAVIATGCGLWIAAVGKRRSDLFLAGSLAGLSISLMHYTGMASVLVGGRIAWDAGLIATSIILGMLFGAIAFAVGLHRRGLKWKTSGAALFTLAICSMHFTAMGASDFANCYSVIAANDGVTRTLMPLGIAAASLIILAAALIGVRLEVSDRRRNALEAQRLSALANAAVEGLVVCEGSTVITVNDSFRALVGGGEEEMAGIPLTNFISAGVLTALQNNPEKPVETDIGPVKGESIPVELVCRPVDFGGRPASAIAVRDLRSRRQAEQYIRFLAHHDALTGLPNRASFTELLEREIAAANRHDLRLAVLCLDLDRFKEVNDLFGHAAGDQLLTRVGSCLGNVLAHNQVAARLGGDEFAIILPDIETPAEAGRVAERVLEAFAAESEREHGKPSLAASIGIALFPDNAADVNQLMNDADTALYRAKQDGRGTYCFFEDSMGSEIHQRRLLEHDLRHAIERNQLRLVYQPQVRVVTRELTGFEALLRWNHPERGEISPNVFIPIAEETGLILQIGQWVLEQACREAVSWKNPLTVAVNVSTVQLHNQHFARMLQELLRRTGLPPQRLEIEITETALVKDIARALATLGQVKALGVRIAMDDFGTGYSSLSNLRAFAFDKLKVDQSFIRSVDRSEQSATIVRAILGLGRGLNVPVLAEGVERDEELAFLSNEVCSEVQGFLLGRPVDIGQFRDFTHGSRKSLNHTDVADAEVVRPRLKAVAS